METYKDGHKNYSTNFEIFRSIQYVDTAGWGLYEIEYKPRVSNERLVLTINNTFVTKEKAAFDNILIRPTNTDVYYQDENILFKNNIIIRR